jgi:3-oxoadipate enol-lactonase
MPHADLDDVRLYYEFDGPADKPVLVLSNSLGTNLHMWDPVMPSLTGGYRVLRYDMRGHGQSTVSPGLYTIPHLAEDLLSLTDTLGIQKFFFCGLSVGGMIGIWLGIHAAHRLKKLVLANTAACIGNLDGWNDRIAKVQAGGIAAVADGIIERWFTPGFRQAFPTEVEATRAMLLASPPAGYVATSAAIRDMDMTSELHHIQTPCLIIAGTHDVATPPSGSRQLAGEIPKSQYVEFPTAHISSIERANDFSNAVLAFLRTPGVHS